MQKISKKTVIACLHLFISGSMIFFVISRSVASSNPYGEQGVNLKDGFKKKDILGSTDSKINTVQLEADQVQFSQENDKATAKGNVVVKSSDKTTLYADQVELNKAIGEAVANGHVFIDSSTMQIYAQSVKYNFNNSTGQFKDASIFNAPWQIKGESLSKVSENHVVMEHGFLTTCDLDEPHFRLASRHMDVYTGDKAIAKGITMYVGKVPVMYFPKYVQDLSEKPIFIVTPGDKKDFGAFLLTQLRLRVSDYVKVIVHADLRERTGIGEGVDVKYTTPSFGAGILRTYYTYENQIASSHLWNMYNSDGSKKGPTIRHELYRIEWRHMWQIDKDTNAVWQYYKVHDYDLANMGFIKKYFEREYRQGPDVNTYFTLTRNLPIGIITYRIDASRVNPALQGVDHFPEVTYNLSGQKLGDTNFYLKSTETFSNISDPQPNNNMKTMRMDVNNQISYPKKIGFFELRPFVGGEHTYYSRTIDINESSVIRGQFVTGSDFSTHFYRMWDYYNKNFMGGEINGLRHVFTPTITYYYAHEPSISANHFNQFDSIDALTRINNIHFAIENKIQTKRNGQSVDLFRSIIETDYSLLRSQPGRSFGTFTSKEEFNPNSWLSFTSDEIYNSHKQDWTQANFDMYIHPTDKWSLGLGKRFAHAEDDQFTTELKYKINPKWKFKIYNAFLVNKGDLRQQDYILTRDLHEWELDIDLSRSKDAGSGIYLLFRLKAFPNMGTSIFSESFHPHQAGTQ